MPVESRISFYLCLLSDSAKCKQLRVRYVFALKGFIVHARKMRLQRDATGAKNPKMLQFHRRVGKMRALERDNAFKFNIWKSQAKI